MVKKSKKSKTKNIIQKLPRGLQVSLIVFFSLFFTVYCLVIIFHLLFWQKIYLGVRVANLDIGTKTQKEARDILKTASEGKNKILKLNYGDRIWEIDLNQFKFNYLPQVTSYQAYLIGRSGHWQKDSLDKIKAIKGQINLDFEYQIDKEILEITISNIAAQIDIPAIPPTIQVIGDLGSQMVEVQAGQPGKQLDQEQSKQLIHRQLGQLLEPNVALPVKQLLPEITEEQAEKTRTRAEKFLGKSLTLSFEENSWQLKDIEIINFLGFTEDFDQDKIASFTAQLAQSIDRAPQNALFNFQSGRVIEFKPAKDGQALNQEQTNQLISQTLQELEKESETEEEIIDLASAVNLSKPTIATEDVNNLGIKELIGRGESWFYGSIASRMHNIKLASSLINGLLVAPGETFSLNEALGDVSLQTGFQQAWIIKEGKTILGDGGGVCQVSTTLFRAVLKAGLPVVERQAHAYRVAYYEQNYQVGIDATVYAPSPDLKFKNDTPGHILIQTYVDTANMKATYNLYGTSDGRQVYISPSRIWDQTPPPPDLYQDDPTLPAGTVKQIDWAAWGAKTAFDWKVTRGDEVLQDKTFFSNYQPWQAIFLRGTGG